MVMTLLLLFNIFLKELLINVYYVTVNDDNYALLKITVFTGINIIG